MKNRLYIAAILAVIGGSLSWANWLTFGGNAQRTGWAKDETLLTKANAGKLKLLWKVQLPNKSRFLNSLTTPLVVNPVYTNRGAEEYVVVGGSSDNLFVLNSEDGKLVWQKHFENTAASGSGSGSDESYFCPDALNDTPVVQQFGPAGSTVFVISIDGKLHALNLVNGQDRFPAKAFVPPNSKNWSLNLVNDVLYTTTSQGCGRAKSGVWAMDLKSPEKTVTFFQSEAYGGGIWGRGGVSAGADGRIYAETGDGPFEPSAGKYGDTFLALLPRELKVADYFTPANATLLTRKDLDMGNSTPAIFPYEGRDLVLGSGKEGTLFLLDSKSLGGDTHRKPLYAERFGNEQNDIAGRGFWGAFSTWQDSKGVRWVYAPLWGPLHPQAPVFPIKNGATPNGSITAFTVDQKDGHPVLTPRWISRDMNVPEPPAVANGIVFALSSGEFLRQFKDDGQPYTAQERIEKSSGAILYAFDAETGKQLYSSEKTIASFTHFGGLAVTDGRVFLTTHDSNVYAFAGPEQ